LEGYRLAIAQGADYIEPDLVSTRDGFLVARHEPNITDTTDVAQHPEFASRRRSQTIDGVAQTGWFANDFLLGELRTLHAVQARSDRPQQFNGQFLIPTFEEIIAVAQVESARLGRSIGIYPETKHPTWHCEQGLSLEALLLAALTKAGWNHRESPVFIQSFEAGNLQYLRKHTAVRLVQLIDGEGPSADGTVIPPKTWAADGRCKLFPKIDPPRVFNSTQSFETVAAYADVIAPWKRYIVSVSPDNHLLPATRFVALAHASGLQVHTWTMRNEPKHLAADYANDPLREYQQFFALGIDGLFSDFPDTAVAARTAFGRSVR
jgi:glycerophosphoryl diester phosphodiesterase